MKIEKLKLNNFRGYKNIEITFDKDLNVIIGKNDIGKSTILEALEIFFNNETIKVDIDDLNVFASQKQMSIMVSFSPEDKEYTIDTVPTRLENEYLLDSNGLVSIKKVWDCTKGKLTAASLKTFIVANYPKNFDTPLISNKIADLRKLLDNYKDTIDVKEVKKNKSSEIRQAIYNNSEITELAETEIPIDKEDGKAIWDSLKNDIPLFFLFQSDRANKDSDKEVQDPLKAITKTAISEVEEQLEEVKRQIKEKAEELGEKTLEKLKEMNPEIAQVLSPKMTNKAWDSLFSFSFNCDDGIPINKRGSGVRRLILLNYFRAEAERKNASERNVIYAIEEPETSQHPDWQIELLKSLQTLSKNRNTQIILTTHSPALASLVKPSQIRFIYRQDDGVIAEKGSTDNFNKIAETLGVLPDIDLNGNAGIKVVLCLEGPTDVEYFNHISKLFDLDIENNDNILSICLGGGTLKHWVNKNYLRKLNLPEIHIYDNDVSSYQEVIDEINSKENCWGTTTNMLEVENYIHPSLIKETYPIDNNFISVEDANWKVDWRTKNIPKELSVFLKELKRNGNTAIRGEGQESIKRKFSENAAPLMTVDLLKDLEVFDEVNEWFNQIKSRLN